MNNNAKKWVQELRSGKWKQTRGALSYNRKTFCCLGVACELYKRAHRDIQVKKFSSGKISYNGYTDTLPPVVCEWIGLADDSGSYLVKKDNVGIAETLVKANDTGSTFSEIADIVEAHSELFDEPTTRNKRRQNDKAWL